MPVTGIIAGCLGALILPGAVERIALRRARAAIPIRIHVNGTRGKSTVTRLIHAALCHADIPALGKVTGTAARLLLPDGSEQPFRRRGRPNIREQLWLLRRAHRLQTRAVVAECMAIHPLLQWASEREMLQSTIGVITNVRTDHTEAMGRTLPEIARSLGNTIPRRGLLVLGETAMAPLLRAVAEKLDTRVIEACAPAGGPAEPGWMGEARAIALAVTGELGIDESTARAGMQHATADPGAARAGEIRLGGAKVPFLDATAANDPESLRLLLEEHAKCTNAPFGAAEQVPSESPLRNVALVYNHRADRPERLRTFLASGLFGSAAEVVVTGDLPCATLWRQLRQAAAGSGPLYISSRDLFRQLEGLPPRPMGLVFCGNTRGLELPHFEKGAANG